MSTLTKEAKFLLRWGVRRGVYVCRGVNSRIVKVGSTHHVYTRVKSIACQRREPQEILAVFVGAGRDMEQAIHRTLAADLVEGREWFREGPTVRAWLESIPTDAGVGNPVLDPGKTVPPRRRRSKAERAAERERNCAARYERERKLAVAHGHDPLGRRPCEKCRRSSEWGRSLSERGAQRRAAALAVGIVGIRAAVDAARGAA